MLGKEHKTIFRRTQLKELMNIHTHGEIISREECIVMKKTMEFTEKTVEQVYTPISKVFMVSICDVIGIEELKALKRLHFARLPVLDENNQRVIGIIQSKHLLRHVHTGVSVKDVPIVPVPIIDSQLSLWKALRELQATEGKFALVRSNHDDVVVGILTMHDIMHMLTQREEDEMDVLECVALVHSVKSMQKSRRKNKMTNN